MKGGIRVPPSGTILPTGPRGRSRNPVTRPCTGLGTGCLWSWATQDVCGGQIRVSCTLQGPAQDLLVIWSQLHGLTGELRIKVVQAIVICDLGLEGRQGLLLFQLRILTRA